jgi:aspartyl-tRNA(Asn)/glutamyl-tRNA(Gln) amidotransferase subunit A
MTRAVDAAVSALARAGAEVVELPEDHYEPGGLLDFEAILRFHRTIMCVQAATFHEGIQWFPDARSHYAPRIAALIDEGLSAPAVRYLEAEADHSRRRRYLEATYTPAVVGDALIMPATLGPAPGRESTGDPAFNSPWSYLGWPAASFPIGLSPDGLPLAVQLVGVGLGGDQRLLETASWCEDAIRRASAASAGAGAGPRSD